MFYFDHAHYKDINLKDWQELDKIIPERARFDKMTEHPGAKTKFIMLKNFYLQFVDERETNTRTQALSIGSNSDLFDKLKSIPSKIVDKFKIEVKHKNYDWKKHITEDDDNVFFDEGDPRIEAGWQFLTFKEGNIKDLNLFAIKYDRNPESRRIPLNQEFYLSEIIASSEVVSHDFLGQFLTPDNEVKLTIDSNATKPITAIVISCDDLHYSEVGLEEINGIKKFTGSSEWAFDIIFKREQN